MNPLIEESLHRRTSATVLFPMHVQGEPPMLASSLPNYVQLQTLCFKYFTYVAEDSYLAQLVSSVSFPAVVRLRQRSKGCD